MKSAWDELIGAWESQGFIDGERPGPRVEHLIQGGMIRLWLDRPGGISLFANHQGGYRVHCPHCGQCVTPAFVPVLELWRRGGRREMDCPYCDSRASLERLDFKPDAGFASWALVLSSVESLAIEGARRKEAESALGTLRPILRRVG